MKVEILRPVMISGAPAEVGALLDLSLKDAQLLIGNGKARIAPEGSEKEEPKPEAPKRVRKAAEPEEA